VLELTLLLEVQVGKNRAVAVKRREGATNTGCTNVWSLGHGCVLRSRYAHVGHGVGHCWCVHVPDWHPWTGTIYRCGYKDWTARDVSLHCRCLLSSLRSTQSGELCAYVSPKGRPDEHLRLTRPSMFVGENWSCGLNEPGLMGVSDIVGGRTSSSSSWSSSGGGGDEERGTRPSGCICLPVREGVRVRTASGRLGREMEKVNQSGSQDRSVDSR